MVLRATMNDMGSRTETDGAGNEMADQGPLVPGGEVASLDEPELDWWHRDHPVFVPLVSFYAGLVGMIVLPALYVATLRSLMEFEQAERWFWLGALLLLVPVAMILVRRSRRAGWYVLLGMVAAVVVLGGTASVVLWVLMR